MEEETRWEERKIDEGGRKRRKRSIGSVWPACECGEEERGKILSERASPENQTPKERRKGRREIRDLRTNALFLATSIFSAAARGNRKRSRDRKRKKKL